MIGGGKDFNDAMAKKNTTAIKKALKTINSTVEIDDNLINSYLNATSELQKKNFKQQIAAKFGITIATTNDEQKRWIENDSNILDGLNALAQYYKNSKNDNTVKTPDLIAKRIADIYMKISNLNIPGLSKPSLTDLTNKITIYNEKKPVFPINLNDANLPTPPLKK